MKIVKKDIERSIHGLKSGKFTSLRAMRIPGVKAVLNYRFGQWLAKQGTIAKLLLTPIYYWQRSRVQKNWGIDIPREASIGQGLVVGHFGNIFISKHAVIGKNLNISHGVTIGMSGKGEARGVPEIGNNVYIAPGAKVFGKIKIGDNVKIGANAVIYRDIPPNSVVVLKPGFEIISSSSEREQEIREREINFK